MPCDLKSKQHLFFAEKKEFEKMQRRAGGVCWKEMPGINSRATTNFEYRQVNVSMWFVHVHFWYDDENGDDDDNNTNTNTLTLPEQKFTHTHIHFRNIMARSFKRNNEMEKLWQTILFERLWRIWNRKQHENTYAYVCLHLPQAKFACSPHYFEMKWN